MMEAIEKVSRATGCVSDMKLESKGNVHNGLWCGYCSER